MLSKFADTLEGKGRIQNDLDKMKKWSEINHEFYQGQVQRPVFVMEQLHEQIQTREGQRVTMNHKFTVSVLLLQKRANNILCCMNRSVTFKYRKVLLLLYLTLVRPHMASYPLSIPSYAVSFGSLISRKVRTN